MNRLIRRTPALFLALMSLLILWGASGCGKKEGEPEPDSPPSLGYATEGVAPLTDSEEEFAQQFRDAGQEAKQGGCYLNYKPSAVSVDGINFSCSLGNDPANTWDMYIQIFSDEAMTDQLFLSQMIRPGQSFDQITLDHALDPGSHDALCAFTWVDTAEDGSQTIANQVMVVLRMTVGQE